MRTVALIITGVFVLVAFGVIPTPQLSQPVTAPTTSVEAPETTVRRLDPLPPVSFPQRPPGLPQRPADERSAVACRYQGAPQWILVRFMHEGIERDRVTLYAERGDRISPDRPDVFFSECKMTEIQLD